MQAGGREQGLHVIVAAEQEGLGLGQPALPDPQLGQCDRRVPGRAREDLLELVQGPHEQVLGLPPTADVAQQGAAHAGAVGRW